MSSDDDTPWRRKIGEEREKKEERKYEQAEREGGREREVRQQRGQRVRGEAVYACGLLKMLHLLRHAMCSVRTPKKY